MTQFARSRKSSIYRDGIRLLGVTTLILAVSLSSKSAVAQTKPKREGKSVEAKSATATSAKTGSADAKTKTAVTNKSAETVKPRSQVRILASESKKRVPTESKSEGPTKSKSETPGRKATRSETPDEMQRRAQEAANPLRKESAQNQPVTRSLSRATTQSPGRATTQNQTNKQAPVQTSAFPNTQFLPNSQSFPGGLGDTGKSGQTITQTQQDTLQRSVETLVAQAKKQGSVDLTKVQTQLKHSGIQVNAQQAEAIKKQVEILAASGIGTDVQKVLANSKNVDQLLKGISDLQSRINKFPLPEIRFADGSYAPDLIVETLNVNVDRLDKRKFNIIAVLRNGEKNEVKKRVDYPGGGKLIIHQMNETINLDGKLNFDFSRQGNVIASGDIPRLKHGQAIRLTATADGGSFTAITIPITVDADPRNNYKQVFKTAKFSLTVTEQMMKEWIKPLEMKIHVHDSGSFALFNQQKYELPRLPRTTVDIKIGDLVYYVNNINSTKIDFDLRKSSIEWDVSFETDGAEIVGEASGRLSDKFAPDVNADQIKAKISLPFHFDEARQLLKLDDPKVSLQAAWSLNITFLPKDIRDSILKDERINRAIESGITDAFKQHRAIIEKSLNGEIKKALNGGTIKRMTPQDNSVFIEAEAKLSSDANRR